MKRFDISMIRAFMMLFAVSLMICGCSEDGLFQSTSPKIDIESQKLTADYKGGTVELEFYSSKNWTLEVDDVAKDWCHAEKTSGLSGYNVVNINVKENPSYDERNVSITLCSESLVKVITLTQKQKGALLLESNKVEIDNNAQVVSIEVQASAAYTVKVVKGQTWISEVQQQGTRSITKSMIMLDVEKNESFDSREGSVEISCGDIKETINIYQRGYYSKVLLSSSELFVGSDGGTVKVEVTSNTEYTYQLPDVDWLSEPAATRVSTYTHSFNVAPNYSYDSRSAEVVFINSTTGKHEVLTITQLPKDAIFIAKPEYNISYKGDRFILQLNANVDFTAKTLADWVQLEEIHDTRSVKASDIEITIDENTSMQPREGVVMFTANDVAQTLVIHQDGMCNRMEVTIVHDNNELKPSLSGYKMQGSVEWGDGNNSTLNRENNHSYSQSGEKTVVINSWGAEAISLDDIVGVSSITIDLSGGKDASVENFDVEKKEWK